jgi:hypothetical protein
MSGGRCVSSFGHRLIALARVLLLSISNSTFRCPRLLSARMMSPFLLLPTPERGVGGAPGGAHLASSFALARRESRVSETQHIPLRPGRRPSALHRGDFRPPGRRVISGCANRIGVATCPETGRKAWPGPGPPVPRFAPQRRDATPRSALQDRLRKTPLMSEDANLLAYLQYVVNMVVEM